MKLKKKSFRTLNLLILSILILDIFMYLGGIAIIESENQNKEEKIYQNHFSDIIFDYDEFPDEIVIPGSSAAPEFTSTLSVNDTVFSPQNEDGTQDNVEFSFTASENSLYNISIEEDGKLINYKSAYCAITGNSSYLHMVYSNNRYHDDEYYWTEINYRNSTDLGQTWSEPELVTRIGTDSIKCYFNLDLVYNSSDNSLYILYQYFNYWYGGGSSHNDDINLYLKKKAWGDTSWTNINPDKFDEFLVGDREELIADLTISNNNSELYLLLTNEPGNEIVFLKSQDGGVNWIETQIDTCSEPYGSAIAVAPDNTITTMWWDFDEKHYYMSNSTNYGASWSTAVKITESRGIGPIDIPEIQGNPGDPYDYEYEWGAIKINYDPDGVLHTFYIYNNSKIYSAVSTDGGTTWINSSVFRDFNAGKLFALDYQYISDGNETLIYSGDIAGITNPGSSFFLKIDVVFNTIYASAAQSTEETIIWNGKNQFTDEFVPDGPYIAKVCLKNSGTLEINDDPGFKKVEVDNTISDLHTDYNFEYNYDYISPTESSGVQDSFIMSFTPDENIYYDFTVRHPTYQTKSDLRVTTEESNEFNPAVAVDSNDRMYCVFNSYQEGGRDIYLKTSDDYGISFTASEGLSVSSNFDDTPAISINDNDIYVVFNRYRQGENNPSWYIHDLFLMVSNNLGSTWSTPVNITMGEFDGAGSEVNYYSPEILVTNNGTVFVAANRHNSSIHDWIVIKSVNDGSSFSEPVSIGTHKKYGSHAYYYGMAIDLDYDESRSVLYAACANYSNSNGMYSGDMGYCASFLNSSDQGDSWTYSGTIGDTDAYLVQGVTLDYLGNDNLRVCYYYEYPTAYSGDRGIVYYSDSENGGLDWSGTSTLISNKIFETGSQPTTTKSYSSLKSGITPSYDVFYVFATDPTDSNTDIYVRPLFQTVSQSQGFTLMDEEISFTWDGTSYWDAISEGEYYINLTLNDVAGNIITDSVNITVDEYSPSVYYYSLDTSVMTPREIQNVTVQTDGGIIDDTLFQLYYRFSATDPWTIVVADYNYIDYYHRWNASIPASLTENDVYFYMNATDYAGNYIILDEQYYFEAEVSITINELSEILSKSSWDPLDLTVEINSGEAYIEKLYINYTLDDVDYQVELDNETQTRYVLSTIDLNAYPDSIDYVLYVEYIDGNIEMLYNISLESPPEVTITIDELSEVLSKTAWDPFDLTVEINSGEAYIEKLYVNYTLDAVIYQVDLENETQTRYVLSTIDLDACPESIDYILYVEYIDGNSVLLYTISLDSPSFAFSIGDISAASTYDSFDMIVTSSIGGEYVNSVYVNFTINSVLNQTFFTQETSTRYVLPTIEIGEFISSIHYFVYAELENGTNYAITDISLSQPSFTLTTDDVSIRSNTGNVKRKLDDLITIIISNIQVDYVDNVYLDYKLDDAVEYSTIQMSLINGSSYSATIEGNPQCYKLEYEVRIVDIKAQTHTVQSYTGVDAITQEYIPSFPEVELTFPMNIVAIVISGAIGAVFSVMSISSKRKNMKQIQDRFLITLKAYSENQDLQSIGIGSKKKKFKRKKPKSMKFIETTSPGIHGLSLKDKNKININEKAVDSIGTQVSVPFMTDLPQRSVDSINNSAIEKSRVIYRLSNLGTLTSLLVGVFLSNVLDEGAIAMLVAAAGLLFSSFGLMERIMLDVSKSLYTEKKYSYFPAIFHTILIASLMITFMYSGTLVPWFNYYVLQETFTAGTIAVPRLYLSLLMPFFSSVVLIIYTSYKELKREMKKFELMKLTGENWKVIWQQKEEKVSKINSNVNMKMLIFIATIAFALISTTQIGRYAEIGMILLIPFIFIWFTAIVINSFFSSEKKSIEEALNNWIIEKVKICPKCETENLFDNRFCIHCQNSFEGKMQIIEDTIKCHRCKNRSPRNSIYCRSCGIILIKKKKRFTKNKKKNIKKQKKKGEEKRSEKLKEPESLPVSLPEPEPISESVEIETVDPLPESLPEPEPIIESVEMETVDSLPVSLPEPEPIYESEEIEAVDSLPESLPEPEPIYESEEIEAVDSLPVSLPEPEPITEFEEMKAVDSLPKTDNIDESKTLKESEDSKESKESKDSEGSES